MSQALKKADDVAVVTSRLVFPVPEMRTKWERLWPKDERGSAVTSQIGYVNTVNTARVYSDGDVTWCWVVHNKLQPCVKSTPTGKVFTSTCFIQPSINQ
ncbi:hypothetical protein B9Z55_016502 [Caenorhabditis nigoni]|uniref:Uncharacterized protein n=1 Tax=Caenorhabditis nigoni TaxID=1611254 RepID=A0A2G5T5A4_9PELO|nr:hypothetical protein B9Z55_016502 [Caenorhabditis nigoni]